jgi:hypothetical protein
MSTILPIVTHANVCNNTHQGGFSTMATNLAIDDQLLTEAQKIGKHRTKKEAVTAALDEYIRRRKQLNILELIGKIDYDENYDYKRERRRKGR